MHRIAGQVGGVEKMIADDRYCIDILTQISAVGTALEAVAFTILDDHVNHCVAHALAAGDQAGGGRKEPGTARSRPPLRPHPLSSTAARPGPHGRAWDLAAAPGRAWLGPPRRRGGYGSARALLQDRMTGDLSSARLGPLVGRHEAARLVLVARMSLLFQYAPEDTAEHAGVVRAERSPARP